MREQDVDFARDLGLSSPSNMRLIVAAASMALPALIVATAAYGFSSRALASEQTLERLSGGLVIVEQASSTLSTKMTLPSAPGVPLNLQRLPPMAQILSQLAEVDLPQLWLTRVEAQTERGVLRVHGAVSNPTALPLWLAAIKQSSAWSLVRQQQSAAAGDSATTFQVELAYEGHS